MRLITSLALLLAPAASAQTTWLQTRGDQSIANRAHQRAAVLLPAGNEDRCLVSQQVPNNWVADHARGSQRAAQEKRTAVERLI